MTNELQIFKYNTADVRTVMVDGDPWFVLKDVCEILGLSNPTIVADRLDDDEKDIFKTKSDLVLDIPNRGVTIVNECGLYNVILRSDKPEARKFKRWVTHEVLPPIRKHGAYMTPETLEAAILNPDTLIRIATALKEEQNKNKALEAANSCLTVDNTIMKPKAEYFDELVDRNLLTNFRETAKQLEIKERHFIQFLLERKYVYRDKRGKLLPHAEKNNGLFEVKECFNDKTDWSGTQTLVTPKGRETFRLLCLKTV